MLEPKEVKELNREKKALAKCGGNCQKCESLHFYSTDLYWPDGRLRAVCYAFGCDKCPYFGVISENPKKMHAELLEAIEFELS